MGRVRIAVLLVLTICSALPARAEQPRALTLSGIHDSVYDEITAAILQRAYDRLGISTEIRMLPAARALETVSSGRTDGELARVYSVGERFPSLVRVYPPLFHFDGVVFSKKNIDMSGGIEALRPYRIGHGLGIQFAHDLFDGKGFNVDMVGNESQLLDMLDQGRLDVAIIDRENGLGMIRDKGLEGIHILEPPLVTLDLYHYLHVKHEALAPSVSGVLYEMRDNGEFEELIEGVRARIYGNP